ncbi:Perakine reductase [Actinidia chinensis var. chinensis]|uniref:Perakine reductase n=1 Tax=Actinidia chinensis var. chinensis TaxID=1590841 RepID=A0A2R6PK92_ACTCC|nr:Perakine reductase [Actinidia chinensis var. chinensis]
MIMFFPLQVSRLGFGCAELSGSYNHPLSHEAGGSVLKEPFSMGVTFFDTADFYGENHDNEIMLGKDLKQLPLENVQLATKFGVKRTEGGQFGGEGTPECARQCCEASLERLEISDAVPIDEVCEQRFGNCKTIYL